MERIVAFTQSPVREQTGSMASVGFDLGFHVYELKLMQFFDGVLATALECNGNIVLDGVLSYTEKGQAKKLNLVSVQEAL